MGGFDFTVNSFGHIYAGGNEFASNDYYACILKSTNNGINWSDPLPHPNTQSSVRSMTTNYLEYIFVGTLGSGIYRSINNGNNWTAISLSNNNVWSLLSVDSTTSIFAGTGGGKIFRSTDDGFVWNQVYINPNTTNNVRSLAKSKTNILYAGLETGGIITSSDNGTTWTQSSFTVPEISNSNCRTLFCFISKAFTCTLASSTSVESCSLKNLPVTSNSNS